MAAPLVGYPLALALLIAAPSLPTTAPRPPGAGRGCARRRARFWLLFAQLLGVGMPARCSCWWRWKTLRSPGRRCFGSWSIPAAFAGVVWGIVGGALPGISPSIAMALLLPFTYGLDPITAVVMLAGVYVGAEYGGSIPAILIRTPGTNAAAATVIDGYEMKRQGRGGEALGISLVSGLSAGCSGWRLVVLTEPLRASRSRSRRPPTSRSACSASA